MTTPLITENSVLATEAWRRDALCLEVDPELFFPESGNCTAVPARRICAKCPVLLQCREYALARRERFGIWGGWTYDQRADHLAGRPVRECTPRERKPREPRVKRPRRRRSDLGPVRCGTRRGYRKHLREDTETCQACRDANAAYNRQNRSTASERLETAA